VMAPMVPAFRPSAPWPPLSCVSAAATIPCRAARAVESFCSLTRMPEEEPHPQPHLLSGYRQVRPPVIPPLRCLSSRNHALTACLEGIKIEPEQAGS
jgi:hypothetical protein